MILFISNDVVTVLQFSLENFGRNGFDTVAGDNISVLLHLVLSVSVKLAKVQQLPTKTPIHIFEGFMLCSVIKFKDTLIYC